MDEELLRFLDERDRRYMERFAAAESAVTAALAAAQTAVDKAERAAEKRFEASNEFRGQLSDQAATFMPRAEAEIRLGALEHRENTREGRTAGLDAGWGYLVGALGVLIAVAGVVVAVVR